MKFDVMGERTAVSKSGSRGNDEVVYEPQQLYSGLDA